MDDYIIVDGVRYPAIVKLIKTMDGCYVKIQVKMTYAEARETFKADSQLVIDYGEDTKELPDYRILYEITDKMDGTIVVTYNKLSDLEKLIELHYGGVNNEGSI